MCLVHIQAFPAKLQVLNYYTYENASTWLDVDAFMVWLSASLQSAMKTVASNSSLSLSTPPSSRSMRKSLTWLGASSCRNAPAQTISVPIEISDDSDTDQKPSRKRNRTRTFIKSEPSVINLASSDPDSDSDPVQVVAKSQSHFKLLQAAGKQKAKHRKKSSDCSSDEEDSARIRITRQLTCRKLVTLTTIPSCWTVPKPGEEVVYLLDLSNDTREWKGANGEFLSMAVIIKSQVQTLFKCLIAF